MVPSPGIEPGSPGQNLSRNTTIVLGGIHSMLLWLMRI